MDCRMENWDSFRVVGLALHTTNENQRSYQEVPAFWQTAFQSGRQMELLPLMNQPPFGILGLNIYGAGQDDLKKFDYLIACSTDRPTPDEMSEYVVPSATWAIFPCKRDEIPQVEMRIVTEWLPASDYTLCNTGYESGEMQGIHPDIELYGQGDAAEVWVAVQKKIEDAPSERRVCSQNGTSRKEVDR